MMRKKKCKSLAVFFAALSASLFIPLAVNADEANDFSITECGNDCKSHTITGGTPGADKRIQVSGGKHTIILENVNIEATDGYSAFDLTGNAEVELVLVGNNVLKGSDGCAGLHIPSGNTLKITGEGNLTATGGTNSAGIGGEGDDDAAGTIIIATTNTTITDNNVITNTTDITAPTGNKGIVKAYGGEAAAGIGGGRGGGCGSVTIESGTVIAYGGDGYALEDPTSGALSKANGGTGIGTGGNGRGGGEIALKGGNVIAIGGKGAVTDDPQRSGVDCSQISSAGSANLYSNSLLPDSTGKDEFSGIVWLLKEEKGTTPPKHTTVSGNVYGKDAILDHNIKNISIHIQSDCTLIIPPKEPKISMDGEGFINGDSSTSIINMNQLSLKGKIFPSEYIQKKVTLAQGHIHSVSPNLTYTGQIYTEKDLLGKAYKIDPKYIDPKDKNDPPIEYDVDTTGWEPHFYKGGLESSVQTAGKYTVRYTHSNPILAYKPIVFDFTIDKASLNDVVVTPADDDITYNGSPQEPKLNVTFNGTPVYEGRDYQKLSADSYQENTDAGTAKVILNAGSNGNFRGENVVKTFEIKPATLSDENVVISSESVIYNGKDQEPEITVTYAGKELVEGTDYIVKKSSDDFTNANSSDPIVLTIEGKKNYTGTITKTFTIEKRPLLITQLTAKNKTYDGNAEVEIDSSGTKCTGIDGNANSGIAEGDNASDIKFVSLGIVDDVVVNDVDGYPRVKFNEYILDDKEGIGKNYTIENPTEEYIPLDPTVKITQAEAYNNFDFTMDYDVDPDDPNKETFFCTLNVTNGDPGASYQYRWKKADGGEFTPWSTENKLHGIIPEETFVFQVQSVEDPNVIQSKIKEHEKTFELLPEPRMPDEFEFIIEDIPGKLILTGTIRSTTELGDVEYFIGKDGVVPSDEDYSPEENAKVYEKCESDTKYNAYVRFRETITHKPGTPRIVSATAKRLDAKPPTITVSPNQMILYTTPTVEMHSEGDTTIHFTLDDTVPTKDSPKYTEPFEVTEIGEITIRAIAVKDNMNNSSEASVTFTRRLPDVKAPKISPENGAEFTGKTQEVTITCETDGADIYYTLDGSDPDPDSDSESLMPYNGKPFEISETTTVKAIAIKRGEMNDSKIASATITKVLLDVKTPVISPEDGSLFHTKSQEVTITCETNGAKIYYTTDGSDPDPEAENVKRYRRPFEIEDTTTVKAIAVKEDMNPSGIASAEIEKKLFTVKTPKIIPEEDIEFTGSKLVKITCDTDGADIYYTTDGNDPTTDSIKYRKPFRVSTTTTIKAFAVKENMNDSAVASVVITQSESSVRLQTDVFEVEYDAAGAATNEGYITDPLFKYLKNIDTKVNDDVAATKKIRELLLKELTTVGNPHDFIPSGIKFYDIKLQIKIDNDPLRDATPDDFPEGGYTATIPYPEGTNMDDNDFAIAHMCASEENAGDVEVWYGEQITKTKYGLQFMVTSASPFAVATKQADPDNEKSRNLKDPEDGESGDGENGETPPTPSVEAPSENTRITEQITSSTNGSGNGATESGVGSGSASGAVQSALSSFLPKTGDTSKIVIWIVLAVACIAVIAGVQIKSKKGNGKKKKH